MVPAKCAFNWKGDIPFTVGYKFDEADPELKKNGCDTTISAFTNDYNRWMMIGGSTADKYLITDGQETGCETPDQMVPYVQAVKNGNIQWIKVFTDNGSRSFSEVALIAYPIEYPRDRSTFRFFVVLKSRIQYSHLIIVLDYAQGTYSSESYMRDIMPIFFPDDKLPTKHQFLPKVKLGGNRASMNDFQVYYLSVENNNWAEIVQIDFYRDEALIDEFHTVNKHRINRYPMIDDFKFRRPLQSIMLNDKNDQAEEILYFGGSIWPDLESEVFCPVIMRAQIQNDRIAGYNDNGAFYFDCSSGIMSTIGPWFSIDVMSSSGSNLMFGLGAARDINFNLVTNDFMIVFTWKLLANNNDNDHYFNNCEQANKRVIATKIQLANSIFKAQYITHDVDHLMLGFLKYSTSFDVENNNPSSYMGLLTYRSILDAHCDIGNTVAYDYSANPNHEYLQYSYLQPCKTSNLQLIVSDSCDATSVIPDQTDHASTAVMFAFTSTYGADNQLNNGGKIGLIYNRANAQDNQWLTLTKIYDEWKDLTGTTYSNVIENTWLGNPVSEKEQKGEYEDTQATDPVDPTLLCSDSSLYTQVSLNQLGCFDPSDQQRCEIKMSGYSKEDFLDLDFIGMLTNDQQCIFNLDSLIFSSSLNGPVNVQVGGQDVKKYGWQESDLTFQPWNTIYAYDQATQSYSPNEQEYKIYSQQYHDQYPPIHHPTIKEDGTGFFVHSRPQTTAWKSLESFEFYVLALLPDTVDQYISLIEGDRTLKISFNPWGNLKSSNSSFEFTINSGDLQKYLASGSTYSTKWEVMTEDQKVNNQQYQNLPEGEKFPYYVHSKQEGSTLNTACDCYPVILEAFEDELMTVPLSVASYSSSRRRLSSSGLIQTFAITQSTDLSATPFVDIVLDLKSPGYQEIWVKVTDKLYLEYSQKLIFQLCGAERFDESSMPNEILIEFDQNTLNDPLYDFEAIQLSKIESYFNLIPGNNAPQATCAIDQVNMFTDKGCRTEYNIASNDSSVINYLQDKYVTKAGNKISLIAFYTENDYSQVYYVQLRTQGQVESVCKPINFKINLICPTIISFDYNSITTATTFDYAYNTGQYQIDLVPFLAHLDGLKGGKCSLDQSLAFQIKKRNQDKGEVVLADLKSQDVESLKQDDSVFLSTSIWAEKDSLMLILNTDDERFQDCIKAQNEQNIYGNCSLNLLVQFWNGGISDQSYAFIELSFIIKSTEPIDLSKFMNFQPIVEETIEEEEQIVEDTTEQQQESLAQIVEEKEELSEVKVEEEIIEEKEVEELEDEMQGLDEDEIALLEQSMSQGIFESQEVVSDDTGPPKAKSVGPIIPSWKTVASEEDVLKFVKEMKQVKNEEVIEKKKKPTKPRAVKFKVSKISRDGKVDIGFNQKMQVPPFEEFQGNRRQLRTSLRMADLNVQRDIVDISFDLRSGVQSSALKYNLVITDWTPSKIEVFMNFSNPGAISQGNFRDGVSVKFKNFDFIKSAESDEILKSENAQAQETFPKQVPKGMDAKKLEENASQATSSMTAIIIIQVLLQITLKGSIDDTWNMFLILQLCAYAQIYDISFPVNVEIYIEQFRSLIRFEILKPDNILQLIDPDLSVDLLLGIAKGEMVKSNMESSGFKSTSFLKNMMVYIFVAVVCLLAIIGMIFMRFIDKLQPKVDKALRGSMNKFFFNNYVRSMTITYLETAIAFKIMCDTTGVNFPLLMQLILFPVGCGIALIHYRKRLNEPAMKDRIEKMYVNISMRKAMREPKTVLYYPVFMIRRLLFVMIPIIFSNMIIGGNFRTQSYGSLQLYALIFFSSLYIIQYGILQPHDQPKLIKIELFNETLFMLLNYHMFFYTKFLDQHPLYNFGQGMISNGAGWSYLGCLFILAAVNLGNLAHITYKNSKRMKMLKRRKILIQTHARVTQEINKRLQTTSNSNLKPLKAFSYKTQPAVISDKEDLDEEKRQIDIDQLKKDQSLEQEIENLFESLENQSRGKKHLRPNPKQNFKKKRIINHLDTIKEEDSKFLDSDFMQQPDLSMSLVSKNLETIQEFSGVKRLNTKPESIDDMEKLMVEIEMQYQSRDQIDEHSNEKSNAETPKGKEVNLKEIEKLSFQTNNRQKNDEPVIVSQQKQEADKKDHRRRSNNTKIKAILNLKQQLRKKKNLKY